MDAGTVPVAMVETPRLAAAPHHEVGV